MSIGSIQQCVRVARAAAGLKDEVHVHMLRHYLDPRTMLSRGCVLL
jgi:site-specific recombinase XerD